MNIGGALVNGYDAYKGFSRQKEQDKLSAIAQAAQYHKEGASTDFLNSILEPYGLDASIFNDWDTGDTEEMSMSDMMGLLTQAAGVQDDGHPELAQYMLKVNNIDPSILGSYSAALYKNNNSGSSGSGRRSGGSGSSSGSRSSGSTGNKRPTPTYAQLLDMADDYTKMKDSDPRKTNYGNTLQYYNMIDTPNLLEKNTGLTGQSWKGDPANKWGTGTNSEKQNVSDDVLNRVAGYAQRGMNGSAITVKLQHEGYSNEEIAEIFNRVGI